jgi:uncharacterized protein (TIRG00374 family)
VFGFLVMLGLLLLGDLRQVGQALRAFRWAYFPTALALTLFNYTLRFFKFHFYLGQVGVRLGARGFPLLQSARLFVAGFPLAVTPAKAGEALKAVWLQRATGLPVAQGVAVVVAERISGGLAVLALATLGVIAYPQYWPAFLALLVVLGGVVVVFRIRPLAYWALDLGERLPLVQKMIPALRQFYEGSYRLFRPGPALLAVGLGTLSWLGEGIGFYLILLGLGLTPGWELASLAVFILSFSTLVGAVSSLPGGLGAAEASIAGMLALLANTPTETAAAATLLIRFATLWLGVSLGLLVWAVTPALFRLESSAETNHTASHLIDPEAV